VNHGPLHRIFIAVELDPALRGAVSELEGRLTEAGVRLRWIPAENLHFTVRFLGEITPAQVAQVKLAARAAAAETVPFRLTLHGVGAFPSLQQPRVVWIGVREGGEELAALSGRLDDALAGHRFPRENRPYEAHLTLARVRDRRLWRELVRALEVFHDATVGGQEVRSLSVMESHLRPGGARYVKVEEVTFGPTLKSPA